MAARERLRTARILKIRRIRILAPRNRAQPIQPSSTNLASRVRMEQVRMADSIQELLADAVHDGERGRDAITIRADVNTQRPLTKWRCDSVRALAAMMGRLGIVALFARPP
jgi:hypothetical protein